MEFFPGCEFEESSSSLSPMQAESSHHHHHRPMHKDYYNSNITLLLYYPFPPLNRTFFGSFHLSFNNDDHPLHIPITFTLQILLLYLRWGNIFHSMQPTRVKRQKAIRSLSPQVS